MNVLQWLATVDGVGLLVTLIAYLGERVGVRWERLLGGVQRAPSGRWEWDEDVHALPWRPGPGDLRGEELSTDLDGYVWAVLAAQRDRLAATLEHECLFGPESSAFWECFDS